MPTYDFRCKKCFHKFSKRVSSSEKDKVTCPECNERAEQIFTGFLYKKAAGENGSSGGCSGGSCASCSGC
ncbi:MAG: hypothetical protein PWQ96_2299 [Clostridia bacterium]|nr:regulatory protein FmdB family [Clostridiales bacterium]MDK2986655.1 hypothetical protein [Clostridia bacterium]